MRTGVVSTKELRAAGWTKRQVNQLLAEGRLTRVTYGWYALADANPQVARAVALGGRLGCLSGCEVHGIWVPHTPDLHLVYGRGIDPRARPGVVWHPLNAPHPQSALCPLNDCLAHVIRRHDAETALICLESATNRGLIKPSLARFLIDDAQPTIAAGLKYFNPAAESGSETRVRLALQRKRVQVSPQVWLPGVGRVDLIAGDSLIIECDSDRHHADVDRDRRRDQAARELGFATIRLSYQQIWHTWEDTLDHLVRIVRTRAHRLPLYPMPVPDSA